MLAYRFLEQGIVNHRVDKARAALTSIGSSLRNDRQLVCHSHGLALPSGNTPLRRYILSTRRYADIFLSERSLDCLAEGLTVDSTSRLRGGNLHDLADLRFRRRLRFGDCLLHQLSNLSLA